MSPNTAFTQALDLVTNTVSFLLSLLFDNLVQGQFNIAARYCEPENNVPSRANTLQFLLHGATYDRNYVSPSNMNFTYFALHLLMVHD